MNSCTWNNVETSESSFMQIKDDTTKVRIGSNPREVKVHFSEVRREKKRVNCPGGDCPLCGEGEKAAQRFYTKVINRADGKAYVLEIGPQIVKQIKALANDPKYGNPGQYDIAIKKVGVGKDTKYTVVAAPQKTSMTNDEINAIKALDMDKLIKMPTVDEIYNMGFDALMRDKQLSELDDIDWN